MAASHHVAAAPDDTGSTTESEQMYLITIAMAAEDGHKGPVPVPALAEALDVSRVSANEMVKKLAERGLVAYTPYKGAELTQQGEGIARTVLRRRRLWALFLADHLGLTPAAADAVACEFEHITPVEVAEQLSHFLGDPRVGPQGKPIPSDGEVAQAVIGLHALAESLVGRSVEVVRVDADPASHSFLEGQGIAPGAAVTVLALSDDGGCLLDTSTGHVHVSAGLAATIAVSG
ncbi:MAG: metal-dependent transcriptional regulator [Acidimicrobiia bacterium]|nr:metal-dependent transcriptional regulator [Acidimicrobiia bacterium]MBT8192442.1 metal-dependent transcriptional regulator [Acidimicrobiia bacterium]NNF87290.1 metal-dependent transcriptional regulator [Acidimicrobiia bacterium]NNL13853.1 metal-dependent transcriptional regulator [Acidimicrobiia bacterium]NNL98617.1 metal-dependent transcriptional regulator [Acidimicrobiia bacterium]